MPKRRTVEVYQLGIIEDGYGGYEETLKQKQLLHGILTTNINNVVTDETGSALKVVTLLKVHDKIENPTEAVLKIEDVNYRIVGVANNIGKRHFYQLEQLTGGEVLAN